MVNADRNRECSTGMEPRLKSEYIPLLELLSAERSLSHSNKRSWKTTIALEIHEVKGTAVDRK